MNRSERRRRNRKNRKRDHRKQHHHACWCCNYDKLAGKPRRQEVAATEPVSKENLMDFLHFFKFTLGPEPADD